MIKVNDKEIPFSPGMTVADALNAASQSISAMNLVMVDKKIIPVDQINREYLIDEAQIKILMVISGG